MPLLAEIQVSEERLPFPAEQSAFLQAWGMHPKLCSLPQEVAWHQSGLQRGTKPSKLLPGVP